MASDGFFNIKDFGALGNGIADDTLAIQACLDACLMGGGGAVEVPTGIYPVSKLRMEDATLLFGMGAYASILRSNTANLDVLTLQGRGSTVHGLGFDSAVPRTAGKYIALTPTSRATQIRNFLMRGAYIGVEIDTGATCQVNDGEIIDGASLSGSAGIQILQGFDLSISNVLMDNPATAQPAAGIRIINTGDLILSDLNIIHCTTDLAILGGHSIYARDCFFDAADMGIWINAVTPVERCHFHGCWTSSHKHHGVLIDPFSPSTIDSIEFIGHHSFFNGNDGVHFGKGNNLKLEGSSCCGNLNGSGIGVGEGAQHVLITGNKLGSTGSMQGNGYGCYLINGCDYIILSGNDLLGNLNQNLVGNPMHFNNLGNFW